MDHVLVEAEVELLGCTIIGETRVGYRSYANDSLLRHVSIGRYCAIGRRCSVGAARHDVDALTIHPVGANLAFESDPLTIIGNDVWIGDNALILSGLTIGDGAVIAGGAVVTRDVAPYTIVGGVPAREIRKRFSEDIIAMLMRVGWWRYGDAALSLTKGKPCLSLETVVATSRPPLLGPHFEVFRPV